MFKVYQNVTGSKYKNIKEWMRFCQKKKKRVDEVAKYDWSVSKEYVRGCDVSICHREKLYSWIRETSETRKWKGNNVDVFGRHA